MASPEMVALQDCVASLKARYESLTAPIEPVDLALLDALKAELAALQDQLLAALIPEIAVVVPVPGIDQARRAVQLLRLVEAYGQQARGALQLVMSLHYSANKAAAELAALQAGNLPLIPFNPQDALMQAQATLLKQINQLRKAALDELRALCE